MIKTIHFHERTPYIDQEIEVEFDHQIWGDGINEQKFGEIEVYAAYNSFGRDILPVIERMDLYEKLINYLV